MIKAALVVYHSQRASRDVAVQHGKLTVNSTEPAAIFSGHMPIISFAWITAAEAVRYQPAVHSLN